MIVKGIGKYRHRVTIQKQTEGQDDFGGNFPTWTDHKEVFAAINPMNGKEYWEAKKENSEIEGDMLIRYLACPDLQAEDRILFKTSTKDKTFQIISLKDIDEKTKEWHIFYKEVVP